jgi:hypothetical protein
MNSGDSGYNSGQMEGMIPLSNIKM